MAKGWIKLHRQIQDSAIWVSNEPFDRRSAWIDLLLSANHEDKEIVFDGKKRIIKRGQVLTSVRKLGPRWGWSKDRVLRFLRTMEDLNMVTRSATRSETLLTIVKYDDFQNGCDTHKDTYKDTDKDTHKDTDKPQTRIDKNINNEKNNAPPTSTFTPYKGGYGGPYKKTAFHNIEQNEYDFADLERMLLERGRKKLNE